MRSLILLAVFSTGFTGLVYEMVWHRYLANFLGSQAQAAALILATFLGGLSIGYRLFGRLSKNWDAPKLLRVYALVEGCIGLWALVFPQIYAVLWATVGIAASGGVRQFFRDLLLTCALILPPTILMGATLPLLTKALSNKMEAASRLHAAIYATNTAGAFFGTLAAGFWLLPAFGLPRTLRSMGMINVAAAGITWLAAYRANNAPTPVEAPPAPVTAARPQPIKRMLGCAFLAGFYALCLQMILIRLVGISMGSSEYALSMTVAVYVLLIAAGAGLVGGVRISPHALTVTLFILCFSLAALYHLIPLGPYAFHVLRSLLGITPNFYAYHAMSLLLLLLVLGIPVAAMGTTLPLIFHGSKTSLGLLGDDVGRIYSWNTLGCVCGAYVGGYGLLYYLNCDQILRLCIALALVNTVLIFPWHLRSGFVRISAAVGLILLGAFVIGAKPWDHRKLANGLFHSKPTSLTFAGPKRFYAEILRDFDVIAYKDDPNTSVAVVDVGLPRGIFVNGKSDGFTVGPDRATTKILAHLPALLHTASDDRAAVVGFGTGITLGSLLLYDEFKEVSAIEIAPMVRRFAPLFDDANGGASASPRLHWKIADAYRTLGAESGTFAVVISQPSNPWVVGVERLYTQDFYQIALKRLAPGGIFAQWVQAYSISPQTLGLIYNTFASAFPYVRVFRLRSLDLILLGSNQPIGAESLDRLGERYQAKADVRNDLAAVKITSIEALLALEFPVDFEATSAFGLHTLAFPKLAFMAGKDFFSNASTSRKTFLSENADTRLKTLAETR